MPVARTSRCVSVCRRGVPVWATTGDNTWTTWRSADNAEIFPSTPSVVSCHPSREPWIFRNAHHWQRCSIVRNRFLYKISPGSLPAPHFTGEAPHLIPWGTSYTGKSIPSPGSQVGPISGSIGWGPIANRLAARSRKPLTNTITTTRCYNKGILCGH